MRKKKVSECDIFDENEKRHITEFSIEEFAWLLESRLGFSRENAVKGAQAINSLVQEYRIKRMH